MLTDVRLPGQLIVSDQMFIASPSCPYFGNTFVEPNPRTSGNLGVVFFRNLSL